MQVNTNQLRTIKDNFIAVVNPWRGKIVTFFSQHPIVALSAGAALVVAVSGIIFARAVFHVYTKVTDLVILKHKLTLKNQTISDLEKKIETLKAEKAAQEESVGDKNLNLSEVCKENEKLQKQVATYAASITTQLNWIKSLQNELQELKESETAITQELAKKQGKIDALTKELAEQQVKIDALTKEVEESLIINK